MGSYWFKPKKYGWGVYPVTWQGWLATCCLATLCVAAFFADLPILEGTLAATAREWVRYGMDIIILTTLFLLVINKKIDGGLKWRWGRERGP